MSIGLHGALPLLQGDDAAGVRNRWKLSGTWKLECSYLNQLCRRGFRSGYHWVRLDADLGLQP